MIKNTQYVENCLLGYGYASLIACHKLSLTYKKEDILILKNTNSRFLFTMEKNAIDFSPLPIYPVEESELYNSTLFKDVPDQKPITVDFSSLENFKLDEGQVVDGSLASFMIHKQGVDRNLCLGLKQWGKGMLKEPLSQVQTKIKKHYMSSNGNTRIGYINGKSLYKHAIDKLQPTIKEFQDIERINLEKKEIHLNNGIVRYDTLISTIPLHYLLELSGLETDHNTAHASALFYFFSYDSGLKENQMLYDCDCNSPITRIFSITDTFLMVQIGGHELGKVSKESIQERVKQLVPDIKNPQFEEELFVPMSYPLEEINTPKTLQSLALLKNKNVVPFGRFGNWSYTDLHELDWSII